MKKTINLALQGGGAHGAFTWGVLDRFLEKKVFTINAISGTSAGSMNAVVLAQGFMTGKEEGAREALHNFWLAISKQHEKFNVCQNTILDNILSPFLNAPFLYLVLIKMTNILSPYQLNPFNFQPTLEILEKQINFAELQKRSPIKLFICATNVKTSRIKIFKTEELTSSMILASSCLPKLSQTVKINDEYYWNGGYTGNPSIFPLIYETDISDILIIHLVPMRRNAIPQQTHEIETRLREISFNAALMREIRAFAFVNTLIKENIIKDEYKEKLKDINLHLLKGDDILKKFPLESVLDPDLEFLIKLRDLGRRSADKWLDANYDNIGKNSTINFDDWL